MHAARIKNGLLIAVVVTTLGCSASPWSKKETVASAPPGQTSPPPAAAAAPGATNPSAPQTPASNPPSGAVQQTSALVPVEGQTIESILAEIRQTQSLDARSEEELVRNLRATPPNLWPMVVQQFRAAMAYRRQARDREQMPPATEAAAVTPAQRPQPVEDQAAAYHRSSDSRESSAPTAPLPSSSFVRDRDTISTASTRDDSRPASRVVPLPDPYDTEKLARERERDRDHDKDREPAASKTAKASSSKDDDKTDDFTPRSATAKTEPRVGGDWHVSLDDTIRSLEGNVSATPQSPEELADHARLRMLYAAGGRRDDALRPIPALPGSMQDFWSKELCGLSIMLDTKRNPDPARRAGEAQRQFSDAVMRLRETAPLLVRNLSFVTDVQSYGSFKPFDHYDFHPGQRVLLYAEVENYKIKESSRGYHTALQSSYQILDSRGQRVTEHDFGTNEEHCQNPRRDFFIGYEFIMPKSIPAGKYTLQLTVTDLNGDKVGQSSVDFSIVADEVVKAK